MLSLSKIKSDGIKFGKISAIALALLIGVLLLLKIIFALKETFFPTPPPPPTVIFGVLPKINFPQTTNSQGFNYTIDTLTGELPSFNMQQKIYDMQGYSANLLDLENVQNNVSAVGFIGGGKKLSERSYQWQSSDSYKTLTIDIVTNDFTISSPFISTKSAINININTESQAVDAADTFLQTSSLMPSDIDQLKTSTQLYSIQNGALIPAQSLSNTGIIAVNYFQNDVNNLPIFYPSGTQSAMRLFVATRGSNPEVVDAHFYHQYLGENSGTYPIISITQAFDMLKKGQGYIASYDGLDKNILIKDVVMGYFMGEDKQQYLEPVIVFEGDNNFLGYVPAVTAQWLSK